MNLTIVVCTHNRLKLLRRTLLFLFKARLPEKIKIQILVIANACNDGTVDWLKAQVQIFRTHPIITMRFVEEPAKGKSHALNRAVSLIKHPIVAFVDDDHRIDPDYFLNIIKAVHAYSDAGMFCGNIIPDWDGTEPDWVHDRGKYRIYPLPVPRYDQGDTPFKVAYDGPIPGGGNLFLRLEILQQGGEFLTELGPVGHNLGGSEDMEWIKRTMKSGTILQYVPDVVQYHYVDPERLTLVYLLRKAYQRSASVIRFTDSPSSHFRIPPFIVRKAFGYFVQCLLYSFIPQKRRFYMMRLASSLGELKGYIGLKRVRIEQ